MVVVDSIGQLCFHIIRAVIGLGISKAVCLAIDRVVLIGKEVAIGFFKLFL